MAHMSYDPLQIEAAVLAHAQQAHAGSIDFKDAAKRLKDLADIAETWGDLIAETIRECSEHFKAGEKCTVILTRLGQHAAVDDGAVPAWTSAEGRMVVHTEADARAKALADAAEVAARYPGFPK